MVYDLGIIKRQRYVEPTFIATGGTVTTASDYVYHTFTTTSSVFVPVYNVIAECLIVGGGGGGSGLSGGGAGGYISSTISFQKNNAFTITVGQGGIADSGTNTGGNSSIIGNGVSSTAYGGGNAGYSGGSGGGGNGVLVPGSGQAALVTNPSQGFAGGDGAGGGAGSAGSGVTGGNGATWLNGISYAGGGSGLDGTASSGGGGAESAGTPNTGGGGNGGTSGFPGGSGIVIIRYTKYIASTPQSFDPYFAYNNLLLSNQSSVSYSTGEINMLLIGGGGGGGGGGTYSSVSYAGGGGGAGGLYVNSFNPLLSNTLIVTIGAGGAGAANDSARFASTGTSSTVNGKQPLGGDTAQTITATGGGAGQSYSYAGAYVNSPLASGGSGGGSPGGTAGITTLSLNNGPNYWGHAGFMGGGGLYVAQGGGAGAATSGLSSGFSLISGSSYDATSVGPITSIDALLPITGFIALPNKGFLKYILATASGNITISVAYVKNTLGTTISQSMFTTGGVTPAYTAATTSILFYSNDDHDSLFMDADGKGVIARNNTDTWGGNWDKFQGSAATITNSALDSVTYYPGSTFINAGSASATIVTFPATSSTVWINLSTQKYKVNSFTTGTFSASEQAAIGTASPRNSLWTMSDGVNQFMIGRWNTNSARLFTVNLSTGVLTSVAFPISVSFGQTYGNTTEEDSVGTQLFSIDGYSSFHSNGNFYYGGTSGWKENTGYGPSSIIGKSSFTAGYSTQSDMDIFGSIDSSGYLWFADWGHDDGGLFQVGNDDRLGTRPTNIKKVNITGSGNTVYLSNSPDGSVVVAGKYVNIASSSTFSNTFATGGGDSNGGINGAGPIGGNGGGGSGSAGYSGGGGLAFFWHLASLPIAAVGNKSAYNISYQNDYIIYAFLNGSGTITFGPQWGNRYLKDSSILSYPVQGYGNMLAQGSFNPYSTNWSTYFNGTTDYLSIQHSSVFNISSDFTVEGWFYSTRASTSTIITKSITSELSPFNLKISAQNTVTTSIAEVRPPQSVDFLVIGGGGGGGGGDGLGGAGGGAGGYRTSVETSGGGASAENTLTVQTLTLYTVTVGDGGGTPFFGTGQSGNYSSITGPNVSVVANGGGGGGSSYYDNVGNGLAGGSGGGGGAQGNSGSGTGGAGTTGQGFAGGSLSGSFSYYNNGGGGAGGVGGGGEGGIGLYSTITGTSVGRGGGGGGGNSSYTGFGLSYGGGYGAAYNYRAASNATANTGGGGGGGGGESGTAGSRGGSGVVILRYSDTYAPATTIGPVTYTVTGGFRIYIFTGSGTITFGTDYLPISNTLINLNTWNHISLSRSGSTYTSMLNGGNLVTASSTGTVYNNTQSIYIGYDGTNYFQGYMSNFRFLNGSSIIALPRSPFPLVNNTNLLVSASGSLIDKSNYNFTVSQNGTPAIRRFSPFINPGPYNTLLTGGSVYFDGSTDFLTVNPNAVNFQNNSFSIEFWSYPEPISTTVYFIDSRYNISGAMTFGTATTSTNDGMSLALQTSGRCTVSLGTATTFTSTDAENLKVKFRAWNHIALVRNNTTVTLYINGTSAGTTVTSITITTVLSSLYTAVSPNFKLITNNFSIGRSTYLNLGYYKGYLSNLRILRGAISERITTAGGVTTYTLPVTPLTPDTRSQSSSFTINYVVVAGGGGGGTGQYTPSAAYGTEYGAGGGAGGLTVGSFTATDIMGVITITVGAGGGSRTNGQDSQLVGLNIPPNILAKGGGGGGSDAAGTVGLAGGSGSGGNAYSYQTAATQAGTSTQNTLGLNGSGIGYGNSGGNSGGYSYSVAGQGRSSYFGGGGGGAGSAGGASSAGAYGVGGSGLYVSVASSSTYSATFSAGGTPSNSLSPPAAGTNTGNGGAGSGGDYYGGGGTGGTGGSGKVIIWHTDTLTTAPLTTGTTGVYTTNSYKVYVFNSSGAIEFKFANTSLLINATESKIFDATTQNNIYSIGDISVSNSIVKYNATSIYFDGDGDGLGIGSTSTTTATNLTALGSGDFTIEMWMYPLSLYSTSTTAPALLDSRTTSTSVPGSAYLGYTGVNDAVGSQIGWKDNTTFVTTGTVIVNIWNHVAVVRSGSILTMYINSAITSSTTNTTNYTIPFKYIGISYNSLSFKGYIDDLRITQIARYTDPLLPPPLTYPRLR